MRPLGVSLIGGFELFVSGLLLVISIATALGMGVLGTILGGASQMGGPALAFLADMGFIRAFILLVPSALFGVLGWNLLRMKEWARIVTLVLSVMVVIGGSFGLLSAMAHFQPILMMANMIRLGINLTIIWYLNQPQVKQLFKRPRQMLRT